MSVELKEFVQYIKWRIYERRAWRAGMASMGYAEYWQWRSGKG